MNPLLKDGDEMKVVPYKKNLIQVGDVVVFSMKPGKQNVVHRVLSIDASGIRTKGDNNPAVDSGLLDPEEILGLVCSVRRKGKNIRIYGGVWCFSSPDHSHV